MARLRSQSTDIHKCATGVLAVFDRQEPVAVNGRRTWYFDDPGLQYRGDAQANAYLALNHSEEYAGGMHDAETACIRGNLDTILAHMGPKVSVIDLGCGEGRKSRDIANAAQEGGRSVILYAVDINERFLEIALRNGTESGVRTVTVLEDLTDLEAVLRMVDGDGDRFFNVGANFSLFGPEILRKVHGVMSGSDAIYVSVQLNLRDIGEIVRQYSNPTNRDFAFGALAGLGIELDDVVFSPRFNPVESSVEAVFTILNVPKPLSERGVRAGDDIVVGASFKPSLEVFASAVEKYFSGDFFVDQSTGFAGFVGRKRFNIGDKEVLRNAEAGSFKKHP
ncbi:MAG: L-histidine N(alpha)-methyltransferase [Candidatus Micrarchaeota archaeon]|nr:L-histidine N(alpha)-methyltransferase [Candidatus Micrarchaeota archaeon]